MRLTVLGSGTVSPSAARTSSAYWVESGEVRLLLDCGAGVLHRMASFDIAWPGVTHVAVTHFHADHWGELPAVIFALRWGAETPRSDRLTLIGPRGFKARLEALCNAFGGWILEPEYPLEVIELAPDDAQEIGPGVLLDCHNTPHTEESLAYSVHDQRGRMVYTGDTGPSPDLANWARGCDLLLCECSLPDDRAIDTHLSPIGAGRLAKDAEAAKLVLTHFYPTVEDVDAASIAASQFNGPVVVAADGDTFEVDKSTE